MKHTILITGVSKNGIGKYAAFALAKRGHAVIATTHSEAGAQEIDLEAKTLGIDLTVRKLDIADPSDRAKAWTWDVDVLINNAGVGETGPIAEIPMAYLKHNFEVNVFAALELTQGFVKNMVAKQVKGKIIFISSLAGLLTKALTGPYCATKHALEAIAEAMYEELAAYGINVAVVNPGPYDTGFNDAQMLTMKKWYDPNKNFTQLKAEDFKFPLEQYAVDELIACIVEVAENTNKNFRNLLPKQFVDVVKQDQDEAWERKMKT